MQSDYSRKKIKIKLREEWLKKAREVLENRLNDDAQQVEDLLRQTLTSVQNNETENGLRNLAEKLKSKIPQKKDDDEGEDFKVSWLEKVNEFTNSIPEKVELPQPEERFISSEDDSLYTSTGKLLKRVSRSAGRSVTSVGNSLRKLFGKERKHHPVWTHEVPLRYVIKVHLFSVSEWVTEWSNELRKLETETLLEADAWTLHSSGLIKFEEQEKDQSEGEVEGTDIHSYPEITPTQKDILVFFTEALEKLEELKESHIVELKSTLQAIGDEIEKAVSKAGTFELSEERYSTPALEKKEKNIKKAIQKNESVWNELTTALVKRVFLSMNFIQLHGQVKERVEGFGSSINEFFETKMIEPSSMLMGQLEKAIAIFDKSDSRSVKEIRELSIKHRERMSEHIEKQILSSLREFMEDATLSTKLERFTAAIPEWTKDQPEKAELVEKLDLTQLPPKFEFEKVDWQVLVQRVMNNQIAKDFIPKEVKPEQFLEEVSQGFQEISQIIFTNLEIADEVKKSDEEESFEVAREGLNRAKIKLTEVIDKIQQRRSGFEEKLSEKRQAAFTKLAMLLEKQDVSEVRLTGAEYKAKETAVDWKANILSWWAVIAEKVELFGRFIWRKTKKYFNTVRKFLGFVEREKLEGDKTDLATFLSETDEKIAGLPFIYRRLFDFNKEVDARFYIRRPEQFERFKKGYELWQNNFPSTMAIVGEKGSGKTLFTKLLVEEVLTKHETIEINFEDTAWKPQQVRERICTALKISDVDTTEDLIEAIRRKKKRIIVILENVQNCYIRNIYGFESLEQLLLLISETNKEIMWIASSTRYCWLFLDKVLNVNDYFTHAVETDNLSAEQIEELILKRHRASGYQLKFIADEDTKKSRSFKKLLGNEQKQQDFLKERYFEKLAKLAEGNSSVAMIFWIRSIEKYDETHFYIKPFGFSSISRIDELGSEELFALAAFVMHDSLLPEHLAEILHQPLRDSKLMVSRLTSKSILYKTENGYMLNQLIYRQVVRVLKEANFIH